jgi:cellulose synthase/poly-beta-1,6-N-acetylglucosamine synthase-like glycosyltransferase
VIKVTVVIPVNNPGDYLQPCLASMTRPTLSADECEVIFVDDGSTDDSAIMAARTPKSRTAPGEASGLSVHPRRVLGASHRLRLVRARQH